MASAVAFTEIADGAGRLSVPMPYAFIRMT